EQCAAFKTVAEIVVRERAHRKEDQLATSGQNLFAVDDDRLMSRRLDHDVGSGREQLFNAGDEPRTGPMSKRKRFRLIRPDKHRSELKSALKELRPGFDEGATNRSAADNRHARH